MKMKKSGISKRKKYLLGIGILVLISIFLFSIEMLPEAGESQTYSLEEGQRLDLPINKVKKEINGKEITMFAYNNEIPGPLLKVTEGQTIYVMVKNNIDEETTIHWHGVRLKNKFDGVPGVTQDPIKPGESFKYEVTFPDEGLFWYHPHMREDKQQELGLYGAILVGPKNKEVKKAPEILIIDDLLMGKEGPVFDDDEITHALMGRFGNLMLINWKTDFKLYLNAGEVNDLYFLNAANTRTFNMSIEGAKLTLVGSDASEYERKTKIDSLIIAPSERYHVEAVFDKPGEYRILHTNPLKTYTMGTIIVEEQPGEHGHADTQEYEAPLSPEEQQKVQEFRIKEPGEELHLRVDMKGMHNMMRHGDETQKIEWEDTMSMMNTMMTNEDIEWVILDKKTGKENMKINYQWKQGSWVKLRIANDLDSMHPMQHPMHLHGQRFLVLAQDRKENTNLVWKDTVLVPKGATMDILVDASNPGIWMGHCHIAEHLHSGMMFQFTVA